MTTKPTKIRRSMLDRLRRAVASKDEAGFEEAMTAVESAAEESEAAQEQAEFATMIGQAVATAIAPVVERLDAVEAVTADFKKTRDDEAAAKTAEEKEVAVTPADVVTKDDEALAAFLKAKGLSDEDVAEACKMMATKTDDDAPSDGPVAAPVDNGEPEVDVGAADKKTADSAGLVAEFRDAVARAEILAPGIKLPTFDAKAKPKSTADSICALRRAALTSALDSADRKKIVAPFVTDAAAIGKMSCDVVKMAFIGASEAAKSANAPRPAFDALAPARTSVKSMADQAAALWAR